MLQIKLLKLDGRATFAKAIPDDAGYDLTACSVQLDRAPGLYIVKLGVIVEPPSGHFFQLVARSSLAARGWQLANGVGIIDSGYRGEWCALLTPCGQRVALLPSKLIGHRICQAVLLPCVEAAVAEALPDATERGDSGFGSTGA